LFLLYVIDNSEVPKNDQWLTTLYYIYKITIIKREKLFDLVYFFIQLWIFLW